MRQTLFAWPLSLYLLAKEPDMSFIKRLRGLFQTKEIRNIVVKEQREETREQKPVGKLEQIRSTFNDRSDLLVISAKNIDELDKDEVTWLASKGDKVIVFPGHDLINISVVRSNGYHY
jgi:hypothetical protein